MFDSIKLSALEWAKVKLNFPYTNNTFDAAKALHLYKRFATSDPENLTIEEIFEGLKTMGSKFVPIV